LKSILILGATGIIGRELTSQAASAGWSVTAVSRHPGVQPVEATHLMADVRSPGELRNKVSEARFDVVVDLLSFNVDQMRSTLKEIEGLYGRYIFVSSATVLAPAAPGRELDEGSTLLQDGWTYAARKAECEQFLQGAIGAGLAATIVRPYITYSSLRVPFGIWEAGDVLDRLREGRPLVIGAEIECAVTTLTHASDVAAAIVDVAADASMVGEVLNIAQGTRITWREVYETVAQVLGVGLQVAPVPVGRIAKKFPGLAGKISDRAQDRSFDSSKLIALSSRHAHPIDFREHVAESLLLDKRPSARSFVDEGKIDRLVSGADPTGRFSGQRWRYERSLLRSSPGSWVRYLVGYHPTLGTFRDLLRRARRQGGGNYGVS